MTSARRRTKELYIEQAGICGLCGESLAEEYRKFLEWEKRWENKRRGEDRDLPKIRRSYANISIDHIIPISKGGSKRKHNLHLTHATCNTAKADKSLEVYRNVKQMKLFTTTS